MYFEQKLLHWGRDARPVSNDGFGSTREPDDCRPQNTVFEAGGNVNTCLTQNTVFEARGNVTSASENPVVEVCGNVMTASNPVVEVCVNVVAVSCSD